MNYMYLINKTIVLALGTPSMRGDKDPLLRTLKIKEIQYNNSKGICGTFKHMLQDITP